jgi:hypothetical protein
VEETEEQNMSQLADQTNDAIGDAYENDEVEDMENDDEEETTFDGEYNDYSHEKFLNLK